MSWEGIASETEGADPEFSSNIDLAVRVENGSTRCFAGHGLVEDWGKIGSLFQGSVELGRYGIASVIARLK